MARKASKKVDAWRAKAWYQVLAPAEFNRANIGETLADDPAKLMGRIMESTLGDITGDWAKQNTKMIFRIDEIGGTNAYTSFIGHEMTKDYMRSLVKRRTSKIGANIVVTTKDGCKLRVKPLIFTVKRARTSQIESIRKIMVDVIVKKSKDLSFNDYVTEIVNGKVAAEVYKATKNIYPLRRVEVAKSEVISKPAVQASAPAAAAAPVTAPAPAAEPAAEPKE